MTTPQKDGWGIDPRLERAIKKAEMHRGIEAFLLQENQIMEIDEILVGKTESEKNAFRQGFAFAVKCVCQLGEQAQKIYQDDIATQFPQYCSEDKDGKDNADHT